jgi:hypothetical protein
MKLRAINDSILCTDGDFDDAYTPGGILIKKTIGKAEGITPRWFKVLDVGPDIDYVHPGQWVLVSYGRWTEGVEIPDERLQGERKKIWRVEAESCLAVTDAKPEDVININIDTVSAERKRLEV